MLTECSISSEVESPLQVTPHDGVRRHRVSVPQTIAEPSVVPIAWLPQTIALAHTPG